MLFLVVIWQVKWCVSVTGLDVCRTGGLVLHSSDVISRTPKYAENDYVTGQLVVGQLQQRGRHLPAGRRQRVHVDDTTN